jgi:hypothetical protein
MEAAAATATATATAQLVLETQLVLQWKSERKEAGKRNGKIWRPIALYRRIV